VSEHNNGVELPKTPNPALKGFDKIMGTWEISGPDSKGTVTYEWMEGGFFAIQRFDMVQKNYHTKSVEYTNFDEDTNSLRSRLMGTDGSRYMYTYVFDGDKMYYYYGEKGADMYSLSTLSPDGNTMTGRWHMPTPQDPNGGYDYVLKRKSK
jgi:hypothetical protein